MGMAASQARYLALTARKTNTEYEGQQINQARTALANQSANLFNRLLSMEVPNPPKTTDFTKLQYSYSDGQNEAVIDDWEQLSGVNLDYNYLVNSHYYASIYTGAFRQLADPQVQINKPGTDFDPWPAIALKKSFLDVADSAQQTEYINYQTTKKSEEEHILEEQINAKENNIQHSNISNEINYITKSAMNSYGRVTYTIKDLNSSYTVYSFNGSSVRPNANAILQGVSDMLKTDLIDLDTLNTYLVSTGEHLTEDDISKITENFPSPSLYNNEQKAILQCFGLEEDGTNKRIVNLNDVNKIFQDADPYGNTGHIHSLSGVFLENTDPNVKKLNYFVQNIETHENAITFAKNAYTIKYNDYQTRLNDYNNTVRPSYIGNSELTPLVNLTDEQKVELLQVVKDMKEQGIDADIVNCFDSSNNYLGGVYSFNMNGITYYATHDDLKEAYFNSYPDNGSNNIIDEQYKMPYYNASYVDTRIEKQCKALLETDGEGRFKSVRFDDNSIVYALNTETVTDEAAYEDAMNQYLYEKEKYEKTIADINAKTSIIQKEDRTLELRLKQLDTEQNALKTEMDAVKKVIKDNVDSTFKTFSD